MTTTTRIDRSCLHLIGPTDLREEVRRSLDAVEETGRDAMGGILRDVIMFVEPFHANPAISVTTVAFRSSAGDRAGQVTTGNAVWGDWHDRGPDEHLTTDDGIRVYLDGREEE